MKIFEVLRSEEELIDWVRANPTRIKKLKRPSEAVQLAAVTKVTRAIAWIIKNGIIPSEKVQF